MSGRVSLPARLLIFPIELYRTYVSPTRMPVCRFTPSCSEYAVTALRERGAIVGLALAVIRLLKCAPWHPGGWDPVPERKRGASRLAGEIGVEESEVDSDGAEAGASEGVLSEDEALHTNL